MVAVLNNFAMCYNEQRLELGLWVRVGICYQLRSEVVIVFTLILLYISGDGRW